MVMNNDIILELYNRLGTCTREKRAVNKLHVHVLVMRGLSDGSIERPDLGYFITASILHTLQAFVSFNSNTCKDYRATTGDLAKS